MRANAKKHQTSLTAWSKRVRDCRSSGMSVRAWCREQGVTTSTYYKWERQVLNKAKATDTTGNLPTPVFVELPTPVNNHEKSIVATVRVGMVSLDIYSGADAGIVAVLCRALRHAE